MGVGEGVGVLVGVGVGVEVALVLPPPPPPPPVERVVGRGVGAFGALVGVLVGVLVGLEGVEELLAVTLKFVEAFLVQVLVWLPFWRAQTSRVFTSFFFALFLMVWPFTFSASLPLLLV